LINLVGDQLLVWSPMHGVWFDDGSLSTTAVHAAWHGCEGTAVATCSTELDSA
jgi:hypothetical protein